MQEKAELWELLPPLDYTIQAVDGDSPTQFYITSRNELKTVTLIRKVSIIMQANNSYVDEFGNKYNHKNIF
jgi:hypothetical protein